ncbi:hypothetical protein [Aequorivita antarctica]|uniref:Uncharacterized protein n=1 Tax=Aequorivita antarctica TaxID=153266 RepID=A0A5C6YYU5_9FLAO|nr:hypothetical protein [Aequorivita antarctica]TXD72799.1 hypothetical protein ESU54_11320 [Aequorivita antarctica]SRX75233.1 hypothetical protein AEQU3_02227 [Aequorivita antarctica]
MILKKYLILNIGLFFLLINYSCLDNNYKTKQVSGIYKVDFAYGENNFSSEEKNKYSGVSLTLNKNGYFKFSEILSQKSEAGKWHFHDDRLSGLIVLRYDNGAYGEISQCIDLGCFILVTIRSNGELKKLPFKKIHH